MVNVFVDVDCSHILTGYEIAIKDCEVDRLIVEDGINDFDSLEVGSWAVDVFSWAKSDSLLICKITTKTKTG